MDIIKHPIKPQKEKTVEELQKEISRLKKELKSKKKYGLVWEEKSEDVVEMCKEKLPILKEVKEKEILTDKNKPMNILIEGDNYHALSALNYTHAGKIDVIYIDPPYNTGNKSWTYNNKFVDSEDSFRHSKWVSFMYKRLNLAKRLLKDSGIIICAIDDYEVHTIRMLLDEIFGELNRLGTCVVIHNPGGRQDDKFFPTAHEYMHFYAKNKNNAKIGRLDVSDSKKDEYKNEDKYGRYKSREFRRSGANSRRQDGPGLWYSIYYDKNRNELYTEERKGCIELKPIDNKGIERCWRWGKDTFNEKKEKYIEVKITKGNYVVYVKEREEDNKGEKAKTFWNKPKYSAVNGTNLLKNIFRETEKKIFDYPKSPFLMFDIMKISAVNKQSLILDFFAGSGTTAQAVLELNKEDNGNRRFILCTNNEDNRGEGFNVANNVCYPRIKSVIQGYTNLNNENNIGLGGNLKYYKTDFVDAKPTDKNKKKLTEEATEMLCIKEDTYEEVKTKNKSFRVFKNDKKYTGIIYDVMAIDDFKDFTKKIDEKFSVYIFSLSDDTYDEEFEDMKNKIKLSPIPEAILRVYRRIFK